VQSETTKKTVRPVYAGAVVINSHGELLCQLRDDKPGIRFPGFWTCSPGGHVEESEAPNNAIIRELQEEFEITVKELRVLGVLVENGAETSGTYHAFSARLASPEENLKCNEGQSAKFFDIPSVQNLRLHPVSRKILQLFLERSRNGDPS
jgi:8-oxo-dGTP diphosphatase